MLPPEQEPVTKRVIHTSADFDYAKTMTYSPHAVQIAKELIAGALTLSRIPIWRLQASTKTVSGIRRNGALFYGG